MVGNSQGRGLFEGADGYISKYGSLHYKVYSEKNGVLSGSLMRSGDNGVLFFEEKDHVVHFMRWEDIDGIYMCNVPECKDHKYTSSKGSSAATNESVKAAGQGIAGSDLSGPTLAPEAASRVESPERKAKSNRQR